VGKEVQLSGLEKEIGEPEFWNDSTSAQRTMKNVSALRDEVEAWNSVKQRLHDLTELAQLDDESLRGDLETEISSLEA
jgi:protein subunit release factor A